MKWIFIVLLFPCFFALAEKKGGESPLAPGEREGHGGDPAAAEWVTIGKSIYNRLIRLGSEQQLLTPAQLAVFKARLNDTQVYIVAGPIQDPVAGLVASECVDDPTRPGKKKINLWQARVDATLAKLKTDPKYVNRFIFHEYVRSIDNSIDNFYEISSLLDGIPDTGSVQQNRLAISYTVSSRLAPLSSSINYWQRRRELHREWLKNHLSSRESMITSLKAEIPFLITSFRFDDSSDMSLRPEEFHQLSDEPTKYSPAAQGDTDDGPIQVVANSYFTKSKVEILIELPGEMTFLKESSALKGEAEAYYALSEWTREQIVEAADKALENWKTACTAWRAERRTELGRAYILGDCGVPTITKTADSPMHKSPKRIHFESVPVTYLMR